jgi:predicted adenine nucleotide alpha hydrolase (AANH) superfamily ATPase
LSAVKKLLLHTCCAPCLIAPYQELKARGIEVTAFWYNTNIHPYTEYKARKETWKPFPLRKAFPSSCGTNMAWNPCESVVSDIADRCRYCYETRLAATAKLAKEGGFDAFSTTLLYSRYQKHELIVETARRYSDLYEVSFFYEDWRPLWHKGIELSKAEGMYRQKYCGCIFSEQERYLGGK